jgi:hypothetical protein
MPHCSSRDQGEADSAKSGQPRATDFGRRVFAASQSEFDPAAAARRHARPVQVKRAGMAKPLCRVGFADRLSAAGLTRIVKRWPAANVPSKRSASRRRAGLGEKRCAANDSFGIRST